MNQTFPAPKAKAAEPRAKSKELTSSLRKSQDRESSSSKKSVKFVDEASPQQTRPLQQSIVITDSLDDPKGKVFVVHRSSADSKDFKTNNFYDRTEEPELAALEDAEQRELSRIVSDPKLRIIAPGFEWDSNGGRRDKHSRQKSMEVGSRKEASQRGQPFVNSSVDKGGESRKLRHEGASPRQLDAEDQDDRGSEQSVRSVRFEESNELLKSIYEFNKTSRSQ